MEVVITVRVGPLLQYDFDQWRRHLSGIGARAPQASTFIFSQLSRYHLKAIYQHCRCSLIGYGTGLLVFWEFLLRVRYALVKQLENLELYTYVSKNWRWNWKFAALPQTP